MSEPIAVRVPQINPNDEHAIVVRWHVAKGARVRAGQPLVTLDEDQRLLLVEGVVAERHRVGAGLEQLLEDRLGDAEAARSVLAVDGDEVEAVAPAQSGQRIDDRLAARAADDVAEEEKSHLFSSAGQGA